MNRKWNNPLISALNALASAIEAAFEGDRHKNTRKFRHTMQIRRAMRWNGGGK